MDIVVSFLIGGILIGGTQFISKYSDPSLSPLLVGIPTGIIASFFLNNDEEKRKFLKGYSITSSLLLISVLMLAYGTTLKNININVISIITLILWAILSYVLINFLMKK